MEKMRQLIRMLKKYDRTFLGWLVVRNLVTSGAPYFNTVMTGMLIDRLLEHAPARTLAAGTAVLVLGNALLALLRMLLNQHISFRRFCLEQNYQKDKTAAYLQLDYARLETNEFTDLRQNIRFGDESMGTFQSVADTVDSLIGSVLTLLMAGIVFFPMLIRFLAVGGASFAAASGMVVVLALYLLFSAKLTKWIQTASSQKLPGLFTRMTKENRKGIYLAERIIFHYAMGKDLRAYRADSLIQREFERMMERTKKIYEAICLTSGEPDCVSTILTRVAGGLLYALFGVFAMVRLITVGDIVIYVNTIQRFFGAFQSTVYALGQFDVLFSRLEPVRRLFALANEEPMRASGTSGKPQAERVPVRDLGELRFEHVSFSYPDSERLVLNDVSFTVKQGERIGIVGFNGAGKSTAVKLMCRLFLPTEGRILIHGTDIRDIPREEYTELVAPVFQNFRLFSFSVAENLALGRPVEEERAAEVLERVDFGWKEMGISEILNTTLYHDYEENGRECSGGEAQKLALARCLYTDAQLVLLDEPTSALDAQAEAQVYRNFNQNLQGKTVIYVAHRLSVCRSCDRVLVFDGGRIVQEGTHEELVAQNGSVYWQMWNAQSKYYCE